MSQEQAFLQWLSRFVAELPEVTWADLIAEAGGPQRVAVAVVDVINGFCCRGPLASPRVGAIVPPVVELVRQAHEAGVRRFAFLHDAHTPEAPEFASYPPHCVAGTEESQLVPELLALPFVGQAVARAGAASPAAGEAEVVLIPKNAISAWHEVPRGQPTLAEWADGLERADVRTVVVAGDCTDLCVHQLALPLKLRANAHNRSLKVVVPEEAVQTYDLPVAAAEAAGALPHPGDLLHALFLYHMALNGCTIVRRIR